MLLWVVPWPKETYWEYTICGPHSFRVSEHSAAENSMQAEIQQHWGQQNYLLKLQLWCGFSHFSVKDELEYGLSASSVSSNTLYTPEIIIWGALFDSGPVIGHHDRRYLKHSSICALNIVHAHNTKSWWPLPGCASAAFLFPLNN